MPAPLVLMIVAALLGAAGVLLVPAQRRTVAYAVAVVLVAAGGTVPAVATFMGNPAGHPHPAPVLPFNSATVPTISLSTPACTYTANTTLRVDWTALSSTYSWVGTTIQPQKSTNGGAYSDFGSALAYNSSTVSDASITPASNTYTYQVLAKPATSWSTTSASVSSATCAGRISQLASGAATSQIHTNDGVYVDASGNVYIADTNGNRIDFIPATSGTYYGSPGRIAGYLYTIAGQGGAGNTGDSAAATSAKFNGPETLVADSAGNVYVADTGNHRIRIIINNNCVACPFGYSNLTAGNIYNFAGSTGGSGNTGDGSAVSNALVKFSSPGGLAWDSGGNLLVSDSGNNRIRMITNDTSAHYGQTMGVANTVYNVAGNSGGTSGSTDAAPAVNGSLTSPAQIALDGSNNIYVADKGNFTIRKINAASSYGITRIAGTTGTSGTATGDGGPATSARFSSTMQGVAVDGSGNVYVADSGNNVVRAVSQSGCTCYGKSIAANNIDTVIGTGSSGDGGTGVTAVAARLSGNKGVFFDRTGGQLYIADSNNYLVRRVSINNNVITVAGNGASGQNDGVLAASWGVSEPTGLAVDSSGNVIFADKGDSRIRKWWVNTGEISIISGVGLAGSTGDGGLAGVARNSSPEDVAVDSNGVIYIADTGLNKIRAVCPPYGSSCSVLGVTIPSGYIDTVIGGSTTAGTCANGTAATNAACRLNTPRGVKVASSGDVFIADTTNNKIGWVPKTGASSNTYGVGTVSANAMYGIVTSGLSSPQNIAVDTSNNIFIADTSNNRIKEISPATSTVSTVAGNGTGGHCADGATATGACVSAATGVAVDGSFVYFVDANAYVEKFTVGSTISAIAGTGSAGLSGDGGGAIGAAITPIGITKKAGGNLWIAGSSAGTNMQLRQILGPV